MKASDMTKALNQTVTVFAGRNAFHYEVKGKLISTSRKGKKGVVSVAEIVTQRSIGDPIKVGDNINVDCSEVSK